MIRKILTKDYLKAYGEMSAQEREAYRERVGEWLRSKGLRLLAMTDRPMARAQSLMSMSARWSREDCEAVYEGARLLTALMAATDTWLPSQLWTKNAWRGVRKLVGELTQMADGRWAGNEPLAKEEPAVETRKGTQVVAAKAHIPAGKPQGAAGGKKGRAGELHGAGAKVGRAGELQGAGAVPVRPKHIDQYLHLLPKKTQERGAMVRGLLRELDEAREKARLLMGDEHASADSRAAWARKATKIDELLGKIYKELDGEWEKLVREGRVTVDDLGNAHVAETPDADAAGTVAAGRTAVDTAGTAAVGRTAVDTAGTAAGTRGTEVEARRPATESRDAVGEAEGGAVGRTAVDTAGTAAGTKGAVGKAGLTSAEKHRRRGLRKWLIDLRRGGEGKARERRIEQWKENWKEYLTLEPLEDALRDEKVVAAAKHFGIEISGR